MKKIITFFWFVAFAQFAHGQVSNKAVSFTGTSTSNATFSNISQLNGVANFTFEAWIYISTWEENSYVFSQIASTTNRIDMQLGTLSNKRLYFHISNNVNSYAAADNSSISVGAWHHIVMAYDGTQSAYNMMKVYIDGSAVSLWYSSGNGTLPKTTPTTTANFQLGNSFAGRLDDVRLFNKTLASTDIDSRNTLNKYHPLYGNLIAYWKMDENSSSILDSKSTYNGTMSNASLVSVTDNSLFTYKVVSSYIRSNFYETGAISNQTILNNNDLIYIACSPYANGDLFFDYPICNGVLTNASYLSSYNGRSGVMNFTGSGANMDCGKNLLNTSTAGAGSFTFATWIYIDSWVANSFIFQKYSSTSNRVDIQLGAQSTSTVYFHVANGANNYVEIDSSGLAPGAWHHVAVTYQGNAGANQQVKFYVDGVSKTLKYANGNGLLPTTAPFIQSDFQLGVNFAGKLDETSINLLSLSATEIQNIMNNPIVVTTWNQSKTAAYWKYDDATSPGKDSRTWLGDIDSLNSTLSGYTGATLRLGVYSGAWATMIQTDSARRKFAGNIKNIVQTYGLAGVDLDFEWATTSTQWSNYSSAILAMKDSLPSTSIFTVTLHPLYYNISSAAIAAVNRVSIQCYGPNPNRFPYNQFVTDVGTMLTYGFPAAKLTMGVPFFGTATDNSGVTTSYSNIVATYPTLDPSLDVVTITLNGTAKSITFNGQDTIIAKSQYIRSQSLAGVMSWDLATDVNITNSLSLLRGINSIINANIDSAGSAPLVIRALRSAAIDSLYASNIQKPLQPENTTPGLLLYPNPARDVLNINLPSENGRSVKIINSWGRVMTSVAAKGQKTVTVNVSGYGLGVYMVLFEDENGATSSKKLLIK